jgi:RNA polymerase sigma factor (sigma-70 family)
MVFIALARKAARLASHPALPAWLHRSTQLAAADLIRRESRRTHYEAAAARVNPVQAAEVPPEWSSARPILDKTIDGLGGSDRAAIVLRYFAALSYAEIGRRLRVSENAARMRVERGLDKLREQLRRQGVTSTSAVLGAWLTSEAGAAVPSAVIASAVSLASSPIALAGGAIGSGAILSFMATNKFAWGALGAVALGASVATTTELRQTSVLDSKINALNQELGNGNADVRDHATRAEALRRNSEDRLQFDSLSQRLASVRAQIVQYRARLAANAHASRDVNSEASNSAPYEVGSVDVPPRAISQRAPKYPPAMRVAGQSGQATIDFIVDAGGFVRNAYAISSTNPAFEQPALDAVEAWTFSAGQKSVSAVDVHLQVPIKFVLSISNSPNPPSPMNEGPQDWFPTQL